MTSYNMPIRAWDSWPSFFFQEKKQFHCYSIEAVPYFAQLCTYNYQIYVAFGPLSRGRGFDPSNPPGSDHHSQVAGLPLRWAAQLYFQGKNYQIYVQQDILQLKLQHHRLPVC